jgi:hypothetical protein
MYARGILFGKMKYELGDHSYVRCPETGLEADIEFKTKGYFGGTYDAIGGSIKESSTGKALYELSGLWSREMYIKDLTVRSSKNIVVTPSACLRLSDWEERVALRCYTCQRNPANNKTDS